MKSKRKKLTSKEIEQRQNILMSEIGQVKHMIDTVFMAFASFVKMEGKEQTLKDYMQKDNKENSNVRTKLQKPGS